MKRLKLLFAVILVAGFASMSWAAVELNVANDGFEDRADGSVFATYQNSGEFLFLEAGNTNPLSGVQSALNLISGYESVTLTETSVNLTGAGLDSGTWTVPSSGTIEFYAVKAADAYAFYLVDPAAGTGSWSTFDLWDAGYGGHPENGGGGLAISHFVGYNPGTSVPEPGTLMLLGSGLVGLALYGRKTFKR